MSRRRKPQSRKPAGKPAIYRPQPNGNANPRRFLSEGIVGPGGPHDQNAVVVDMTDSILLDSTDVCVVHRVKKDGTSQGQAIYMTLGGRINHVDERAQIGFMFGPDGAGAIVGQLLSLADRAGPALLAPLVDHLIKEHRAGNVALDWLVAALTVAYEQVKGDPSDDLR